MPHLIRPTALALAAAGLFTAPACESVSSGGIGAMLRQELGLESQRFDGDMEVVWRRVKETLAHLSDRQPVFKEDAREAFATVDEGSVYVTVSADEGTGAAIVAVRARQYGAGSDALAGDVLAQIRAQVEGLR